MFFLSTILSTIWLIGNDGLASVRAGRCDRVSTRLHLTRLSNSSHSTAIAVAPFVVLVFALHSPLLLAAFPFSLTVCLSFWIRNKLAAYYQDKLRRWQSDAKWLYIEPIRQSSILIKANIAIRKPLVSSSAVGAARRRGRGMLSLTECSLQLVCLFH